jgi:hypothetical protein
MMLRSDKKLADFNAIINKGNNILIIDAITSLRNELPFEGAIGAIVSLYNKTQDSTLRKAIESFLNDVKDKSVCIEVINEIRKKWKTETLSMLVASCWQSGLDYSAFTADLTEVFVNSDYLTAIECFTVIEESTASLTKEKKSELIRIIEEGTSSSETEKRKLAIELISVLGS